MALKKKLSISKVLWIVISIFSSKNRIYQDCKDKEMLTHFHAALAAFRLPVNRTSFAARSLISFLVSCSVTVNKTTRKLRKIVKFVTASTAPSIHK